MDSCNYGPDDPRVLAAQKPSQINTCSSELVGQLIVHLYKKLPALVNVYSSWVVREYVTDWLFDNEVTLGKRSSASHSQVPVSVS